MKKLLAMPWELAKALFGLAFPMFRSGGTVAATGGSVASWFARLSLLAVFLLGLGLINQSKTLGLTEWIQYSRIRNIWLPVFAFCSYAMVWLGWLLYRVLNIDVGPVVTEFADIDRAWSQVLDALDRAEIHLEETPLFLVLGSTANSDEALFHAAGIKAQVKQVPRDPTEPLHVTANRDSIWLTCPGASVLGQQNPAFSAGSGGSQLSPRWRNRLMTRSRPWVAPPDQRSGSKTSWPRLTSPRPNSVSFTIIKKSWTQKSTRRTYVTFAV